MNDPSSFPIQTAIYTGPGRGIEIKKPSEAEDRLQIK